jgi:hypothetical protein
MKATDAAARDKRFHHKTTRHGFPGRVVFLSRDNRQGPDSPWRHPWSRSREIFRHLPR